MNPIDRVIAFSQLIALGAWEALGMLAFGWNPWAILGSYFVGLWTFNILTATAVRTFFKLMTPRATVVNNAPPVNITEEDIGG